MKIAEFNGHRKPLQAKIFKDEQEKKGVTTRSGPGAIGGSEAVFVFTNSITLVCLETEGKTYYFASERKEAEAALDSAIENARNDAEENEIQFGDWQLISAYIDAAKSLMVEI